MNHTRSATTVAKTMVVFSIVMGAGPTLAARDMYWCGAAGTGQSSGGAWNADDPNWKVDGEGEPVKWTSDDDLAHFSAAGWVRILGAQPKYIEADIPSGTLEFVQNVSYTWGQRYKNLIKFSKNGAGTVSINSHGAEPEWGTGLEMSDTACFEINAGRLELNVGLGKSVSGLSAFGGSLFRVAYGATMHVVNLAGFGKSSNGKMPRMELNGTLTAGGAGTRYLNELALCDHAAINVWYDGTEEGKTITVCSKLTVTGEVARTLNMPTSPTTVINTGLNLNPGPGANQSTEVYVEDITGNSDCDFTVPTGLQGKFFTANGFVKTGLGTMKINRTWDETLLGEFIVKEGLLSFPREDENTQNMMTPDARTFTVLTNATLLIPNRNLISGGWKIWHGVYDRNIYRIYGGNLIIGDEVAAARGAGGNYIGDELLLDDAHFECNMPDKSSALYMPRIMTLRGSKGQCYRFDPPAAGLDAQWRLHADADGGTTIDVADITGDANPDAVLSVRLADYQSHSNANNSASSPTTTMVSSLIKTGAGTLKVTSVHNSYTGLTVVRNGTLLVDGNVTATTVSAGAFVGGTGMIAALTLEADAGLTAQSGQNVPLTVDAQVAIPATGKVFVDTLGLGDSRVRRARLLKSTAGFTGVDNLANWKVYTQEGVQTGMSIKLVGDTLTVFTSGKVVILR